jgi:hypothetical protein
MVAQNWFEIILVKDWPKTEDRYKKMGAEIMYAGEMRPAKIYSSAHCLCTEEMVGDVNVESKEYNLLLSRYANAKVLMMQEQQVM